MSLIDWAIIVVLLISVLLAAAQGFFVEVFSFAGAVIGYLLAASEYRAEMRKRFESWAELTGTRWAA